MPSALHPQSPADPARTALPWRRGLAFVLLALAVLALHGWLLKAAELGEGRPLARPGERNDNPRAPARQVVQVLPGVRTVVRAEALPTVLHKGPAGAPRLVPGKLPPAAPRTVDRHPARAVPSEAASPQPFTVGTSEPTPVASGPTPLPVPAPAASVPAAAGMPPPVYPTRLPAAQSVHYRAERGAATGTAVLDWQPAATGYVLSLQVRWPAGPPIDWRSRGGFDRDGLAPLRMVERQKERDRHAVNFQRGKEVISFAGTPREVAMWRGAQDRLSWLVQFGAIAQARQGAVARGDVVRLQVAMPRGDVDEWVFTLQASEPLDAQGLPVVAQKWVREPARPYDQRVEVWLAPSSSPLPLGLRWTTVPGGEPLALWQAEGPLQGP